MFKKRLFASLRVWVLARVTKWQDWRSNILPFTYRNFAEICATNFYQIGSFKHANTTVVNPQKMPRTFKIWSHSWWPLQGWGWRWFLGGLQAGTRVRVIPSISISHPLWLIFCHSFYFFVDFKVDFTSESRLVFRAAQKWNIYQLQGSDRE